jgi:hypothetical protein
MLKKYQLDIIIVELFVKITITIITFNKKKKKILKIDKI